MIIQFKEIGALEKRIFTAATFVCLFLGLENVAEFASRKYRNSALEQREAYMFVVNEYRKAMQRGETVKDLLELGRELAKREMGNANLSDIWHSVAEHGIGHKFGLVSHEEDQHPTRYVIRSAP